MSKIAILCVGTSTHRPKYLLWLGLYIITIVYYITVRPEDH